MNALRRLLAAPIWAVAEFIGRAAELIEGDEDE